MRPSTRAAFDLLYFASLSAFSTIDFSALIRSVSGSAPTAGTSGSTTGRGVSVRCSADQAAVAQDRRALEDVTQLADVTGPAVLDEALACLARDAGGRPGDALGEIGEEEVAEREDVLGALAQRRKADLEHLEPVVEILAEGAALDRGTQVAVGGGDEAHVGGQPLGATHTLELPLLEHAQELGLRGQAHLRHLVEEQRASCGELHLAGLGLGRAGERAALVPEQLGLEQVLGQGGTVQRHERPFRATRCAVDGAGDHLLAGS